jgi:hypothetical protein
MIECFGFTCRLIKRNQNLEDIALLEEKPIYFSMVVDLPAKVCPENQPVCNLGFDLHRLSPINGPEKKCKEG